VAARAGPAGPAGPSPEQALAGVIAPGRGSTWAVGQNGNFPVALRWNGRVWR
jgi:hypothetical protein